ncbi:MAG: class I SAM-dependent methyltransferase [Candidatus Heimdallarchaeota archaeon]|nr:class I SAM-dependent methyltransferase [Candidatus Heimdallarchaeota archaeon]
MNSKKFEAARRYNETAEVYDRRYKDIQFAKYREVIPEIDLTKSSLIFDIGGGTGLLLEHLKELKQNIIISDLSFEMLKVGKTKCKDGNFVCADSESLPFRQNCCDTAFYFSILQNPESPSPSLSEGFRILNNDGTIAITVLTKIFEEEKLVDILIKIGFSVDKSWKLSIEDLAFVGKKK